MINKRCIAQLKIFFENFHYRKLPLSSTMDWKRRTILIGSRLGVFSCLNLTRNRAVGKRKGFFLFESRSFVKQPKIYLVPATTAKDLGVIMDPNLTFDNHVLATVSSCMSRLAQINRVKYFFDKQSLIIIINSLVFSKLFYCLCVWSNTSQTNLKMLQTVQNFACRIVSGRRKYDHVSPALKELRWLPVKKHLYYRDAVI